MAGSDPEASGAGFAPVRLDAVVQFVTADGSLIREVARSARQTLAEATLPAGAETREHYHPNTEEIYTFVSGAGRMRLGEATTAVSAGDTVLIPAGEPHKLWNDGPGPLVLLCCCVPPYSDDDTVMTGR